MYFMPVKSAALFNNDASSFRFLFRFRTFVSRLSAAAAAVADLVLLSTLSENNSLDAVSDSKSFCVKCAFKKFANEQLPRFSVAKLPRVEMRPLSRTMTSSAYLR